jgi:hypothetical protein
MPFEPTAVCDRWHISALRPALSDRTPCPLAVGIKGKICFGLLG